MFWQCVFLSCCCFFSKLFKTYGRISIKFSGNVNGDTGNKIIHGDSDHSLDQGILKDSLCVLVLIKLSQVSELQYCRAR